MGCCDAIFLSVCGAACCQEWDMDGNPVVLDTAAVQSDGGDDDGGGDNDDDDVY